MKINVMIVKPNQLPKVTEIENDLFTYQHIVDGYIEEIHIGKNLVALINDEGAFLGMTPNFNIGYMTIVGPAILLRTEGDTEYHSLKPAQIEECWEIVRDGRGYGGNTFVKH